MRFWLRTAALTLGAWGALAAAAQTNESASTATPETWRAELAAKTLYAPDRPVWLRFTLFNPGTVPVQIPLEQANEPSPAVALPLELVLGTAESPALFVTYQDEKPTAVQPGRFGTRIETMTTGRTRSDAPPVAERAGREAGQTDETPRLLRLAPHTSLGAELDLREFFPQVRYVGTYRVEWKPFGGRVATEPIEFRIEPRQDAVLVTDYGKVTFELLYDKAPKNVENFLDLVRRGAYDAKTIHRIIPGFLIQGGCPLGTGTGLREDGKTVPAEFHDAPLTAGTLALARKPDDPNSASCQFFVTLARVEELDGKYTVIGQARDEESLRTLQQIAAAPTDRKDRPRRPVIIRSIALVDAETNAAARPPLNPPEPPGPESP